MSWADCPICQTEFPVLVDQGGYFGKCRCGYTVSGGSFKDQPEDEVRPEDAIPEAHPVHLTVYTEARNRHNIMHGRPAKSLESVERIITGCIGDVCASISREGQPWLDWTPHYRLPEEWDQFLDDLKGRGVR